MENRLTGVSGSAAFVYDGDGKRVKKTAGGVTTLYVNKYYEKKIGSPDEITLYYYLGNRMVALKKGTNLRYVSQDHLTGTSVTSDTSGNTVGTIKFAPFGATRAATGTLDTDIKFTGQRLDSGVDLYYYGARYYDAGIGRFISADTVVSNPRNPQTLNRYSYALNNPLRYIDPTGNDPSAPDWNLVQGDDGNTYWAIGNPSGTTPVSPENLTPGNYGLLPSGAGPSASADGGGGTGPALPVSAPVQPNRDSGGDGGTYNVGAGVLLLVPPIIICGPLCWIVLGGVAIVGAGVVVYNATHNDADKGGGSGKSGTKQGQSDTLPYPLPGDPTQSPGEGWEWRGNGPPGSSEGAWTKPGTKESLHPDLGHGQPIGPHWDYRDRHGNDWRVDPKTGKMTPK